MGEYLFNGAFIYKVATLEAGSTLCLFMFSWIFYALLVFYGLLNLIHVPQKLHRKLP